MASSRITITTVGVGEGADQNVLEEIARIGNGRYLRTADPASVPQIFAKETVAAEQVGDQRIAVQPAGRFARPRPSPSSTSPRPPLLGYVVTRAKPTSELILASESGDPLLTWWRYGLGWSVAFTSDAKPRWAAEWLSWQGFGRFWR